MSDKRAPERLLRIIRALRFNNPGGLHDVTEEEWPGIVRIADRSHLTLPLAVRCAGTLPDAVASRFRRNLENNRTRYGLIRAVYCEIAGALDAAAVPFVVLKGLSNWPYYVASPEHRPQYDIDLLSPAVYLDSAESVLRSLGFVRFHTRPNPATDHLPTMVRKTGWRWRGDYFDPEMPPSVELHYKLWNPETEQISVAGVEQFWQRRTARSTDGLVVPALAPADGVSFSALHLLRHLLRGDVRPYHVYELAHLLHTSAADDELWQAWLTSTPPASRTLQGIAFRLARDWFDCSCHYAVADAIRSQPEGVDRWFRLFAFSPILAWGTPNKDEVLLHTCLIDARASRTRVLLRRLLPRAAAPVVLDPHVRVVRLNMRLRVRRRLYALRFVLSRARHHTVAFASTTVSFIRWRSACAALSRLPDSSCDDPKADREHAPIRKQVAG